MPTFLTPDQLAAENAADARKIRAAMTEFLLRDSRVSSSRSRFRIPEEGDSDYEEYQESASEVLRSQHNRYGYGSSGADRDRAGDMLMLPEGVTSKMIPMSEIMKKQDEKHQAVLKKPWFVQETSNREEVMAEYIRDNVDELLKHVPVSCSKFRLLWEQRLAIVSMTVAMPEETFTSCEIPREAMDEITQPGRRKQPFVIRYSLEKNMLPVFTVADYCTGSGKTIMAISAALSLLCSRERWRELKANYVNILRARIRENNSGLCKMESVESARLARLAIMFVPATVLSAWYQFCQSAVFGAKEAFGQSTDVLVWKGVGGRTQSVQEALHSGKPVLWVLPMESDSLKVVQQYPDIGYAVRIFDEMNMRMVQRYDKPESTALFNYVTQATIESLRKATDGNPRHPMRMAFGSNYCPINTVAKELGYANYKAVQTSLEHFCKMRQFAAPEFIRSLVSHGVQANMPLGLRVHQVMMRVGTLASIATGSGLAKLTLPELARQLLQGAPNTVKDEVAHIFSQAEAASAASMLDPLNALMETMPVTTMAENSAKQAVMRLHARMSEILSGTLPDCPVTLEPIPKDRVRILACCTAVIDANSLASLDPKRCPMCRVTLGGGCVAALDQEAAKRKVEEAEASDAKATKEPKQSKQSKLQVAGSSSRAAVEVSDDEDCYSNNSADEASDEEEGPRREGPADATDEAEQRLCDAFVAISERKLPTVDSVMEVLKAQVEHTPSARILLCFGFEWGQRRVITQLGDRIRREIPTGNVHNIDEIAHDYQKMETIKARFDDPIRYPGPRIFMINTKEKSNSVHGLDLYATDLTVVADRCSMPAQHQAFGRSLRMRKRTKGMKPEDRFPAKRVVYLVSVHNN